MQLPQLAFAQDSAGSSQKGAVSQAVLVSAWSTLVGDVSPPNQSSPVKSGGSRAGGPAALSFHPGCWLMDADKCCLLRALACIQPLSWSCSGKMREDTGTGREKSVNNRERPQKGPFGPMNRNVPRKTSSKQQQNSTERTPWPVQAQGCCPSVPSCHQLQVA